MNANDFLHGKRPTLSNHSDIEYMNTVKEAISKHNKLLPEMQEGLKDAKKTIEDNFFNDNDVSNAFAPLWQKYHKIINAETKHLKGFVERRPNLKWDEKNTPDADIFLANQRKAINKLKEHIELAKQQEFSTLKAQEKTFFVDLKIDKIDDDLPF